MKYALEIALCKHRDNEAQLEYSTRIGCRNTGTSTDKQTKHTESGTTLAVVPIALLLKMTGASADVVDHEGDHLEVNSDEESSYPSPLPSWVAQQSFGEELLVAEWQHDDGTYRSKQGWKVRFM